MESITLLFGANGWIGLLLRGAWLTIVLATATIPFGFGGGLLLALAASSRSRPLKALCSVYTTFFRGVPELLTLFAVYFGLQAVINKLISGLGLEVPLEISPGTAGVIALSLVVAAYSSEVWLSSLKAVHKGQGDAARSLGLSPRKTFVLVIFPQVFRTAISGLGNVWMFLLKETSLISTLAGMDLLRAASEAAKATSRPLLFFSMATAIYLGMTVVSELLQAHMERRLGRGYR